MSYLHYSVSQLGTEVEAIAPHVSQWHGINLPLIFTIVIIAGLLGTLFIDWKYLRLGMLKTASITQSYRSVYQWFERYSGQSIRKLMSNRLNYYLIITLMIFL